MATVGHIVVGRNQWAYAAADADAVKIETPDVFHDHVMTFTQPQQPHWAILARVGADTDLESVDQIFAKMKGMNGGSLSGIQARILGGDAFSTTDAKVCSSVAAQLKDLRPGFHPPHGADHGESTREDLNEYFHQSDREELSSSSFRHTAWKVEVDRRDGKTRIMDMPRDPSLPGKDGGHEHKGALIPLEEVTTVVHHAETARCPVQ